MSENRISRRSFLRRTMGAGCVALVGAAGYGAVEAHRVEVTRPQIAIPGLPEGLRGLKIAVLADIHHSPILPLSQVREAVDLANSLQPDLVALVGDYVYGGKGYIEPVFGELAKLRARYGVFAVLGNHDHHDGKVETRREMQRAGIEELTNRNTRLEINGDTLWLAGVDDLFYGKPNAAAALDDIPEDAPSVLLCHEPQYVERLGGRHVSLMLSGHTHGGQVVLPFIGPPILPSEECRPFVSGLIQWPNCMIYVSRGLGYAGVPVRLNCPPELPLVVLARG